MSDELQLTLRIVGAALVVAMIAYVIYHATAPKLSIVAGDHIPRHLQHGVLWVATNKGGLMPKPFQVTHPEELRHVTTRVAQAIADQAAALGFDVKNFEVRTPEHISCFKVVGGNPHLVHYDSELVWP